MPPPRISRFRRCTARGCAKSTACGASLKACGRCKTSHYCSKACQAADWPYHKEICNSNSAVDQVYRGLGTSSEGDHSDLSINLRRWESLHTPTFVLACILGMNLCQNPQNLFNCALVVNVTPRDCVEHKAKFTVTSVQVKPLCEVSTLLHRNGHGETMVRHEHENQVSQDMGALGQALVLLRCQVPSLPCLIQLKPVLISHEAVDAYRRMPLPLHSGPCADWTGEFQRAIDEDWARLYHMNAIAAHHFMSPGRDALDVCG